MHGIVGKLSARSSAWASFHGVSTCDVKDMDF